MTDNQIVIKDLSKIYNNGFTALKNINLNIKKGEIFAMLGPNGAGKTTLISIICGIVTPSSGKVTVDNFDIIDDYRETRARIGIVPQELTLEQFETVFNNVSYSRGLYGKKPDPDHIEKILKQLSLWDKKNLILRQLSGGMKRRVLIAKALSQAIADRIGVINQGEIIVIEKTEELLKKMGHKKLTVELQEKIENLPPTLNKYNLTLGKNNMSVDYTYSVREKQTGITNLLQDLKDSGLKLRDLKTEQSTLEKIFVNLVRENNEI